MLEFRQVRARLKRVWKAASISLRNLPLTVTGLGVLTCVELFTAGGIVQSTPEVVSLFGYGVSMAALEIGVSYGFGILSFVGAGAVAELKADPRPEQRDRAFGTRLASLAVLLVPLIFFTNALALQTQKAAREQYVSSEAYRLDQANAIDRTLDSVVRAEASANLERAAPVKTAAMDGNWFASLIAAVFIYGALNWAGSALYRPKPETLWEAKERERRVIRAYRRQRDRDRAQERMAELKALQKAGAKNVFDLAGHLRGAN